MVIVKNSYEDMNIVPELIPVKALTIIIYY